MKSLTKPEFGPFVIYSTIKSALIYLIVAIIFGTVGFFFNPIYSIIICLILFGLFLFSFLNRYTSYKKETYAITNKEFQRTSGTLFSDNQTELLFKNVTNIIHIKPFLEYFFFKTSHIAVESAGSATTEIYYRHITNGDETYQDIIKKLQSEFKLNQKPLVIEKPSKIGILLDSMRNLIIGLISLIFIFGTSIPAISSLSQITNLPILIIILGSLFVISILAIIFATTIIKILDQYYRTYILSNSAAMYKEGFLTKVEQIIPFENVSDINSNQTILDRIIGTTTVIISCQGQSQNIVFSYVSHAEHMIDYLKKKIEPFKEKQLKAKLAKKVSKKEVKQKKDTKKKVSFKEQSFGMNKTRALLGPLFFLPFIIFPPVIFVIIIGFGISILRAFFTTYTIEQKKMKSTYDFIQKKQVTFSADKITGVHLKINPIDRLFKTCTVHFWSIGSAIPLQFTHISQEKGRQIIKDLGFTNEKLSAQYRPSFNPLALLLRIFPLAIIIIPTTLILPFVFYNSLFISLGIYILFSLEIIRQAIYYSNAKIEDYPSFTKFIKGVIFYKESYAYDEQVKGFTVTQYPLTTTGTLTMNVAGESFRDVNDQRGAPISHTITMPYMKKVLEHALVPKKSTLITRVKPMIPNVLLMAIYIIPIPFIPFVLIERKFVSFEVYKNQTVAKKGILYKTHKHILDSKLDYVSKSEGMINKIVKNGTVSIHTTGSSGTEMNLYDIKEYNEIYKIIQGKYQK